MQKFLDKYLRLTPKNYVIIGMILLTIGVLFCTVQEVNKDDETWFLQVVNRILSGDVLYRDVFFGAGPLSVYLAALICYPFGAELLLLRFLLALYFAIGVLLACAILKELRVTSRFSLPFILASLIFSHLQSTWGYTGYNSMAKVFFLGCYYFALKWNHSQSSRKNIYLILSSTCAALCFCCKQNVGIIALLILVLIILCKVWKYRRSIREGIKETGLILLAFSIITLICLLPIFFQGGFSNFLDYAFLNKTRYLETWHFNYFHIPLKWDAYSVFIFLVPFLLLFTFILAYPSLKKEAGIEWIIVMLFLGGGILTLYPRPDDPQKIIFTTLALITCIYFIAKTPYLKNTKSIKTLKLSLGYSFAMILSLPFFHHFNKKKTISRMCHFRGIVMKKSQLEHWSSLSQKFLDEYQGESIFFLSIQCGFYYLLFDIPNPTPFDYPTHPALGCRGEEKLLSDIQAGTIEKIYMDHKKWSYWSKMPQNRLPSQLDAHLKAHMQEIPFTESDSLATSFQVFVKQTK